MDSFTEVCCISRPGFWGFYWWTLSGLYCCPAACSGSLSRPRPNEEGNGWGLVYSGKRRRGEAGEINGRVPCETRSHGFPSASLTILRVPDSLQFHHCSPPASYRPVVVIACGFRRLEEVHVCSSYLFKGG